MTTYRRWRPRLGAVGADRVARLAVTAAHVAVFSGLAAIAREDDDGCGRAVSPPATPPSLSAAAEATPPPPPPVAGTSVGLVPRPEPLTLRPQNWPQPAPCTDAVNAGSGSIRGNVRPSSAGAKSPVAGSCA